jgi:hypothetical protein
MMIIRQFCALSLGIACSLALFGCSDGGAGAEGQVEVYPVEGTVKLSGSPLANVNVVYSPVDPEVGRTATGRTNEAGEFTLRTYKPGDGAAAGEYVVLVTQDGGSVADTSPEAAHQQYTQTGGPVAHAGKKDAGNEASTLNPKYSNPADSDLKVTVTKGDNNHPLELKP